MFKKIKKEADQITQKTETEEYKNFLTIKRKWKKEIKKDIQKNAEIIDFLNQKIIIQAKTPTWKNELVFLKTQLKKNYQPTKSKSSILL